MTTIISGDTGISPVTASGTSASVDGMTVGRGGGEVSTNTAVGASALNGTNTGGYTTALGYQAGYSNTSGQNTLIGANSGQYITTGTRNTGVGVSTLGFNNGAVSITSNDNTAQGHAALTSLTSGASNTAIGSFALQSNTTASYNTAVGYQAGYSNQTGANNVFVGYSAGYNANTNGGHTFVGYNAGLNSNSSSIANTFFGNGAGSLVTSGIKNTIIGRYDGNTGGLDIRTASNNIVLSDGDGNPRLYYVGADTAWKSKEIYNFTSANSANMYIGSGYDIGRITSALKYKQDVRDLESIDITKFRAVRYKSKCANDDQTKDYFGFIADEVAEAGIEELVVRNAEGEVESFAYDRMTVVLLKSLQELKTIVDAQAALISGQATEIAELKAKVG